jgi:hypothetical protein
MFRVVTTDGSILNKPKSLKKSLFLTVDKNNCPRWKSLQYVNTSNSLSRFEKFKIRFLK